MLRVLSFFENSHRNPLHNDFASHIDRSRVELWGGSVTPAGELQADLAAMGFGHIALRCTQRKYFGRAVAQLARFLRRKKFDVVHTHTVGGSIVGLLAAHLARVPLRVMTRHHSTERLLYHSSRALLIDRVLSRYLADVTIALSPAVERVLREVDGVAEYKIVRIPNGVDWNRVRSTPAAAARVRRELQLEDATALCAVGRLTPFKGFGPLLAALAQARAQLPPNVRLLIAGTGPAEQEIRADAARLGVAAQCLFLGHRRDVFDVMSAADYVVQPSLSEAQNQVIIEALALCRPVIATDVGAAAEVIIPDRTGWLVPPADAPALAAAITDALFDRERAARFAEAGQRLVYELYPIEKMVNGTLRLYEEKLSSRA